MVIKRFIYSLPALRGYRNSRTRSLAEQHKPHFGGFDFAGIEAFYDPDHEREERNCLVAQMAQADVFIDVGANQGLYTCVAAAQGLQVAAVEPEPGNLRFLMSNVRKNGYSVEIFATALGAAPGVLQIYGDGDTASLVEGWAASPRSFSTLTPVNTIDHLFADRWPDKRLLLKVDVEGFEHTVLSGATRMLARTPRPAWLIETGPRLYDAEGSPHPGFVQVFELMFGLGYACRHSQTGMSVDRVQIQRWIAGEDIAALGRGNFLFS